MPKMSCLEYCHLIFNIIVSSKANGFMILQDIYVQCKRVPSVNAFTPVYTHSDWFHWCERAHTGVNPYPVISITCV